MDNDIKCAEDRLQYLNYDKKLFNFTNLERPRFTKKQLFFNESHEHGLKEGLKNMPTKQNFK